MTTYLTRSPESGAATATPIELVGVEKVYRSGKLEYPALRGVDLSISAEEMVALVGPSGSGKSTVINMITGSDAYVESRNAWVILWVERRVVRATRYKDIDEARAAAERLAESRG